MPKYMLLIYGASDGGPAPEQAEEYLQEWQDYTESLAGSGALLAGEQLQGIETATTVRVQHGETQITDGPFAATKEFLGGYYLLECPDLDAALGHAARAPIVTRGSVEVRPLVEQGAPVGGAERA